MKKKEKKSTYIVNKDQGGMHNEKQKQNKLCKTNYALVSKTRAVEENDHTRQTHLLLRAK